MTPPAPLTLTDHSAAPRAGVKGPGAAAWLATIGLPVPEAPCRWSACGAGVVARLGLTEYLVDGDADAVARVGQARREDGAPGVYTVLHQSLCVELAGARTGELLRQVCSIDFMGLDLAVQPVLLTSMACIGATVLPRWHDAAFGVRIWADGSYGHYLWHTLAGICAELGGGCGAPPPWLDAAG